jgi:hypothetical protein
MLSSVECKAHGYAEPGAYQSHGSCQMKVAFQLSSGENVIHELNSSSDNGGYGGGFTELSGGLLGVWSLGLFDQVLASGASHTSLGHAEDNLRFNLKKMAEELELKGVAKCRDFKDNSSKINSVTSSTTD